MSDTSADQFQVKIYWCGAQPLLTGRRYLLVYNQKTVSFSVTSIKYRLHEQTSEHLSAKQISDGEIAVINISTDEPLDWTVNTDVTVRDLYAVDLLGRGVLEFALHRATNIRWQQVIVDKVARASAKQQRPCCIWFTGLSGAGKSTIANLLEKRLYDKNFHTYLLDGDNLRHGLNRDLGFTESDRIENIRRVAEVSRLMLDAGLVVLASFISPYIADRAMARRLFADGEFIEVFVDASLNACERRDVKGLYAKARRGELKNFTGIDSKYEPPENPEIVLNTDQYSPEDCVEKIINYLDIPRLNP